MCYSFAHVINLRPHSCFNALRWGAFPNLGPLSLSLLLRRLAGNDLMSIPRGAFAGLYNLKVL